MLKLVKASITDCAKIHSMQVKSFKSLLDKYNDIETNPGAESIERVTTRMKQDFTDYYFIQVDNNDIGAIRIVKLFSDNYRISPMFILPEFQGKGYAQLAIKEVEKLYPKSKGWQLDTIKEEDKLCHIYEKMGYKKTGQIESLHVNMTIVYYAKLM